MLILVARVYYDGDIYAPDAFVLKLTPEVLDTLKRDIDYVETCEGTKRFAHVAFDTPEGHWVESEYLREMLQDDEEIVLRYGYDFGDIPDDFEPMEHQHHQLRFNNSCGFEVSFHASGGNSVNHFFTASISYNWLLNEIERVSAIPVEETVDSQLERLIAELGF